ncbi:hypothetical protein SISSUDRAFT_1044649, partial [Sistotremastrum suecicum HHB10207 ss-3]
MPPFGGRDYALAGINGALEHPHLAGFDLVQRPPPIGQVQLLQPLPVPPPIPRPQPVPHAMPVARIEAVPENQKRQILFHLPIRHVDAKTGAERITTEDRKIDVAEDSEPLDVRERALLLMNIAVNPDIPTLLTYRVSNERARESHSFTTKEEVARAIELYWRAVKNARSKEVYLQIENQTPVPKPKEKENPKKNLTHDALKAMSGELEREIGIVEKKTECTEHRGEWCFVQSHGAHARLTRWDIIRWAKLIHDGKVEEDCDTPPNTHDFARLHATPRKARELKSPPKNEVHVHFGNNPFQDITNFSPPTTSSAQNKASNEYSPFKG